MLLTVLAGWCILSLAKKELSIQQCPTVKIQSDFCMFCMLHVHAAVTKKKTPPPFDRRHELLRGVTAWCPWISEISRDFLRVITFVLNPPTHWGIFGCIRVPNLRRPLDAFQCVQCIYMIYTWYYTGGLTTNLLQIFLRAWKTFKAHLVVNPSNMCSLFIPILLGNLPMNMPWVRCWSPHTAWGMHPVDVQEWALGCVHWVAILERGLDHKALVTWCSHV